jgi:hypothetical protein
MTYLRFSPASIFLITNILVPKVSLLCYFNSVLQKSTVCLFEGRHGWKYHKQILKNRTEIQKEETLAHRKRARNALSRERTLEL